MTREEAIARIREHKIVHKMNEPRAIHISEALDMAIKALEQEPDTWSLDDAREDFMSDVYNTLDFLPTNDEANRIIDSFDRVTSGIKKEPKSEWEHDHEILKAYSDGANGVLDEIRAEIAEEKEHAYADFEQYKVEYLGQDEEDALDSLPQDEFRYGMERCIDIIDKFKTESEERMPPERDCVNCVNSKDGHMDFSETCHSCMWENQFIPKFMPKRIKASDVKPDDEWMQEDVWDEIYEKESEVKE